MFSLFELVVLTAAALTALQLPTAALNALQLPSAAFNTLHDGIRVMVTATPADDLAPGAWTSAGGKPSASG